MLNTTLSVRYRLSLGLAGSLFLCSLALFAQGLSNSLPARLDTPSAEYHDLDKSLFLDLALAGSRAIAVGMHGVILYSDNEGKTWSQSRVPVSVLLTSVTFVNERLGWAVGHHGVVLHSEDGGSSWQRQLDGWQIDQMMLAFAESQLKEVHLKRLQAASDLAESSPEFSDALENDLLFNAESMLSDAKADAAVGAGKPLLNVMFLDERHGFVMGAYGLLLETTDAGKSWNYVGNRIDNTDRFHINAMVRVGEDELWVVGEAGILFRSDNRGQDWETLMGPYEGTYFGAQPVGSGVLIYGLRGNAFFTANQGASWQRLETEVDSTLTASVQVEDNTVFVFGNSGTVLQWLPGQGSMKRQPQKGFSTYLGVIALGSGRMLVAGDRGIQEFMPE